MVETANNSGSMVILPSPHDNVIGVVEMCRQEHEKERDRRDEECKSKNLQDAKQRHLQSLEYFCKRLLRMDEQHIFALIRSDDELKALEAVLTPQVRRLWFGFFAQRCLIWSLFPVVFMVFFLVLSDALAAVMSTMMCAIPITPILLHGSSEFYSGPTDSELQHQYAIDYLNGIKLLRKT